jgi:hypothetical protein
LRTSRKEKRERFFGGGKYEKRGEREREREKEGKRSSKERAVRGKKRQ